MGVILLVGREDDLCCGLVRESLKSAGREFLLLPEDNLFPGLEFVWELRDRGSRGSVGFGAQNVDIEDIDCVLARFSGIATSAEEHRTKDGQYLNSEWHALARGYMHSLPCPVINRLRPELWYKTRLSPADLFALFPAMALRLPKTTVTSSYKNARAFWEQCGHRMRYSPISLPSNYPIDTERELAKLEPLAKVLPLYLSEEIEGEAVQAFVAGDEVVFDGTPDARAAKCCLDAARTLGLAFCEFELVRTAQHWYCLGLNCMPYLIQCKAGVRGAVIERLTSVLCAREQRRAA